MTARGVNVLGVFAVTVMAERTEQFLPLHVGEADDGVERRAKFIAHGGEKIRLGAACALGARPRRLELVIARFEFALQPLQRHHHQRQKDEDLAHQGDEEMNALGEVGRKDIGVGRRDDTGDGAKSGGYREQREQQRG